MKRLSAVEGSLFEAEPHEVEAVHARLTRLSRELSARLAFVEGPPSAPIIRNLIGSVQISPKLVVDIEPKTAPDTDWQTAIIDLISTNRINAAGITQTAEMARRPLADAFAFLYADQLTRAMRAAGPLQVMTRKLLRKPALSGRLDVSIWVRTRIVAPHEFPQFVSPLTPDNEYTQALAWVAHALAARVTDTAVRGQLMRLARELRPGLPEHYQLDPAVATRPIPAQWSEYNGAWSTATAVIRRISPLHRLGTFEGLNLAVEPWPLLETLLYRSLRRAEHHGRAVGIAVETLPKTKVPWLEPVTKDEAPRGVEPDGVLSYCGRPSVTFEAKYSTPTTDNLRMHMFQAVTTAAAAGASLAVLVYPQRFEPRVWTNVGAAAVPASVAAIGLDMYGYRRRLGDELQGERLWRLISEYAGLTVPLGSART